MPRSGSEVVSPGPVKAGGRVMAEPWDMVYRGEYVSTVARSSRYTVARSSIANDQGGPGTTPGVRGRTHLWSENDSQTPRNGHPWIHSNGARGTKWHPAPPAASQERQICKPNRSPCADMAARQVAHAEARQYPHLENNGMVRKAIKRGPAQ